MFLIENIGLQSTLVISKSEGLTEIFRDIRTSTSQICIIEEIIIVEPHYTNEYVF